MYFAKYTLSAFINPICPELVYSLAAIVSTTVMRVNTLSNMNSFPWFFSSQMLSVMFLNYACVIVVS
jgi:hypothetical protein